jgi:high-affinity nickel-transport protein
MTKAYGWAFTSPLRKIYYNLTTTSISIFVALVIGTIQLINVLAAKTNIENLPIFDKIAAIDLGGIGFFIVISFVLAWVVSVAIWKLGKFEARYPSGVQETEHQHAELHLKD